jgi:hypothetical protein
LWVFNTHIVNFMFLCFGSSGIVLFCLEIFVCVSNRCCAYKLINWIIAALFTFFQMHFVFCNSKASAFECNSWEFQVLDSDHEVEKFGQIGHNAFIVCEHLDLVALCRRFNLLMFVNYLFSGDCQTGGKIRFCRTSRKFFFDFWSWRSALYSGA